MKHQSKIWKNLLLGWTIITFAASFSACDKKGDATTANLSNEEVSIVLEGALSNGTQGITSEVNDAIFITLQYAQKTANNQYCGITFDSTVTHNINEPRVTASYTSSWNWMVNCNNLNLPTSLDFSRMANGEYETTRMRSNDHATGNWKVSNLLTGTSYTLSGAYTREGSQVSKVRNQNSFTSLVNITITSLNVNKNTLRIESGTATFTLTGSGTGGNQFSYEGTIIFNGNGAATVTINGETFDIQL